ncbi:50S ribosomal protein L11 methyltransferase [Lentimicrobium sp.]|jgi:ribosomal protein L11 methyltransferase|uniref:50S ribosomal protein L11 methyltransferase n=1 Tax=Lentimicrobium sp. TaxID=2034841 RepID=UPI0025F129A2|nr:50S ribosomal protein L11 methyltransferase [Lentimicrobium sp.]MCO5257978.1 50S ribosomal protein L11 methyltransferase [Lentimicrobium sp.]MCO5262094.1 50S ribosomal protein L11 methyltransferase [Lentimicrobium sp.]HPF63574.1 50S ribosomal protein L11 methyltransferase [Lentimicrobium sp.]HPJ62306.1 50S ribosomal protein L11 methyltransferase [Lentimicrobium sp.]HPR25510.1 50S ribosomal protein L11 methyltransferase [Lentimicrobium sp.]
MEYIELNCSLPAGEIAFAEILMARLGELGFESFEETKEGLLAYIPAHDFDPAMLNMEELWPADIEVNYTWRAVPDENWNAVWESNFEPVTIAGRCHIRAPFHPVRSDMEFEIVIEPKMSFGTAHHETTSLMIEVLLDADLAGKNVLDMGCGTGVLAILAAMRRAAEVTAIDNDEWAYHNALENVIRNKQPGINVYQGDAGMLENMKFDVIIANINRNILLSDMQSYVNCLDSGGLLLMSGFYREDLQLITEKAAALNMLYTDHRVKNNWVVAWYTKA